MKHVNMNGLNIKDVASLVSSILKENGIEGVLVGGACVSIYTKNMYQSYDLDIVSYEKISRLEKVLSTIGFRRKGKYMVHPDTPFYVDFVAPPVAVGNKPVSRYEEIKGEYGSIILLTPTDCVMDRLASYFHWNDTQALEQAIMVTKSQTVDISVIEEWSQGEGHIEKFHHFLYQIFQNPGRPQ